jgi:hypothetical protein
MTSSDLRNRLAAALVSAASPTLRAVVRSARCLVDVITRDDLISRSLRRDVPAALTILMRAA